MLYDFCVVGGGIVGLATALNLLERRPGASLLLVEKEKFVGRHQTGHNSGVIHSGIYYQPGGLKARLCVEGCTRTKQFCAANNIPFEVCGKLVVATNSIELKRMADLHARAVENGADVERIGQHELRSIEPNVSGIEALLVRSTGIVDYRLVCEALLKQSLLRGGETKFGTRVTGIIESAGEVQIETEDATRYRCKKLVVCGGLQADRLARAAGLEPDCRIIPFRGEYYRLPANKAGLVRHLIYPVPDPDLPFLGIHLTRMIDGTTTVGPNAVLGLSREGYRKFSFDWRDAVETLSFGGFWRVIRTHWRASAAEMRNSMSRRAYLNACRKYCPSLEASDLLPHEAGIRAQAVLADGTLVHDFMFVDTPRSVHVLNAPSPAATSALPIGRMIADRILGDTSAEPSRSS